ncbi:hypothetical protein ACHAXT_002676 [Thalassiosira profunda]
MNPDASPFVPSAASSRAGAPASTTPSDDGRRRRGRRTRRAVGSNCNDADGMLASSEEQGRRHPPHQQKQRPQRRGQGPKQNHGDGEAMMDEGVDAGGRSLYPHDEFANPALSTGRQPAPTGGGNGFEGRRRAPDRQRKHKGKRRNNPGPLGRDLSHATSAAADGDAKTERGLDLTEGSFPSLSARADSSSAKDGGDADTPWDEECLADKLSLEMERQELLQRQQQLEKEQSPGVRLTALTPRSLHERDEEVESSMGEQNVLPGEEDNGRASATNDLHSSQHEPLPLTLPNTRSKWSGAEVSKMRERLWEVMKTRRRQRDEAKNKKEGRRDDEESDNCASLCENASSDTDSSLFSSSSSEESLSYKPVQPVPLASPNTPFDEVLTAKSGQGSTSTVSQSILELEMVCVQSPHPLHCAVYNIAFGCDAGAPLQSFNGVNEQSDAEVVLSRLLSIQDADVTRWKRQRVGLSDLRKLGANDQCKEALMDDAADLLSADTASLTPLQLAIYRNLPWAVRILCADTSTTGSKFSGKGEEEDEFGRTPLMLACELGHSACIQALLCVASPKLDRRERKGGNTAFHFCCLGRSSVDDLEEDDLDCNAPVCVEAIDALFRYTPPAMHKRALLLTNRRGQNILHLACSRGDLRLVERLLDQKDAPGVKISKALDANDGDGHTPFLAAVAADATEIVLHLLTARLGLDYSSWFAGCPLVVAASNGSVDMVNLLLGVAYDASGPEMGGKSDNEANRALLEVIYRLADSDDDGSESAYEIIRLLIEQGGANPHLSVSALLGGKQHTHLPSYLKRKASQEDTPLLKTQRRNDPLLRSQPESYFRLLEEKEDDVVHLSVDAALVTALFLLWDDSSISADDYGRCAILLYRRGRSNLSAASSPRKLSQNAMHWLEKCLSSTRLAPQPSAKDNSLDVHLVASFPQFIIPNKATQNVAGEKVPYSDAAANFLDWSHVLANLPWFASHSQPNAICSALRDTSTHENLNHDLAEDEFYLVAEGKQLLAHKSIVSARSGKLAAQIRFTDNGEEESPFLSSIHVDLPLLVAKMLLCHCYHGSIALGLMKSPLKQCDQLLEMALMAEEYLCPSLLLECEMRLLAQMSPHSTKSLCLCPHCCGGTINPCDQIECPVQRQCLDNAKKDLNDDDLAMHCEPVGVYSYKSHMTVASTSSDLVTPDTALDVLAVAQQLEQFSCEEGSYALKSCVSHSTIEEESMLCMPTSACRKMATKRDAAPEGISAPFAAAKMAAVHTMLRDFPSVVKSDSYLRHSSSNNDAGEEDGAFGTGRIGYGDDAILLLRTCLDELASNPFKD